MFRILPIVGAFVLGALVSWCMVSPSAVERKVVKQVDTTKSEAPEALIARALAEERTGIPPDTATAVRSVPGAGQKRAVSQALRKLEQHPPDVPVDDIDPEASARFADTFTTALAEAEGETR